MLISSAGDYNANSSSCLATDSSRSLIRFKLRCGVSKLFKESFVLANWRNRSDKVEMSYSPNAMEPGCFLSDFVSEWPEWYVRNGA